MAVTEEPILSRLDRLDNMLRQVEEIRGGNRSPKSSSASTPSSGTLASEGQCSSFDLSPKSIEKHCLPINRVMGDIEVKGTLVQRIDQLEQRLLKLEGEIEAARKREEKNEKSGKNKGLKGLVNKMVKGNRKNHQTQHH